MMTIMNCCCFFASLRTATYVTVLYTLIYFGISCVTVSIILLEDEETDKPVIEDKPFGKDKAYSTSYLFNILSLLCAGCGVLSSFLVVIGLQTDRRELLLPWMFVMIADLLFEFGHFLFIVIFEKIVFVPVTAMIFTVEFFIMSFNIYCLLCVLSQYQEYRAGRGCAPPETTFSYTVEAVHFNNETDNNHRRQPSTSCLHNIMTNIKHQKLLSISSKDKSQLNCFSSHDESPCAETSTNEEKSQLTGNACRKCVKFPD